MAFDVSALSNYTEQNKDLLVSRSMFSAKSQMIISKEGNLQTGVKSAETVNILATDAIFQTGGTCGFNSSGTTSFSQRTLTVGKFKVNESLCPKTLESKYTQTALQLGSRNEKIPFEQYYADLKAGTIAEQLEMATWQGDTGSGNVNVNKFDGFIKLIDTAAVAANANPTSITVSTGITSSNVRTIIGQVIQALPVRIKGKSDVRVFCGWDVFSLFVDKLVNDNLYHYAPAGTESNEEQGEIRIPGTQYLLTAVHGLDSTNRIFGLRVSNMYIGVDLENEEERWELFFAKEADEVRFVAEWKFGVQVAFPDEIASFKLVP
jgi:hypothetical protein